MCKRGRPSLCPASVSESGPLAGEGMRGAGQRRCEFGPVGPGPRPTAGREEATVQHHTEEAQT